MFQRVMFAKDCKIMFLDYVTFLCISYDVIDLKCHIFPKAQVAANKNTHNFRHHFLAQFFMLFHMVWSILFHGSHHVKEHEKLCPKMMSEFVCIFVYGHMCLWKDVSKILLLAIWCYSVFVILHQGIYSSQYLLRLLSYLFHCTPWYNHSYM